MGPEADPVLEIAVLEISVPGIPVRGDVRSLEMSEPRRSPIPGDARSVEFRLREKLFPGTHSLVECEARVT